MYRSNQAQACPEAAAKAENTQVTQFSTRPATPECCGAAQAVSRPFFRTVVSSIASPVPSPGPVPRTCCARPGSISLPSSQDQRYFPAAPGTGALPGHARPSPRGPGSSPARLAPGRARSPAPSRGCAAARIRQARKPLTSASGRSMDARTSPMLAVAAMVFSCLVTNPGTTHGRPSLHARHSPHARLQQARHHRSRSRHHSATHREKATVILAGAIQTASQ
jgi:hypothetical protein